MLGLRRYERPPDGRRPAEVRGWLTLGAYGDRKILQQRMVDPPRLVLWNWQESRVHPITPRGGLLSAWRQTQVNNMTPLWYGLVTWVAMDGMPVVTTQWIWDAYLRLVEPPAFYRTGWPTTAPTR